MCSPDETAHGKRTKHSIMASGASKGDGEAEKFVGYVPLAEYKKRKEELASDAAAKSVVSSVAAAVGLSRDESPAVKKRRKKDKQVKTVGLSFGDEEEEDGEDRAVDAPVAKRTMKAPGVDTSFLAKSAAEKETAAKQQQERLKEVLEQQQRAKEEEIELAYIFRNEAAKKLLGNQFYRGSVRARRGATVGAVLEAIHAKLCKELSEKVSSQLLLIVSNEYHHLQMQMHMTMFDIFALEWQEGGKMFPEGGCQLTAVERTFLESNGHLYPMVQWSAYDQFRKYSHQEAVRNRSKATVGVANPRGASAAVPPGKAGAKPGAPRH